MILCCGEALIDMVPADAEDARFGYVSLPGGAIFNTAIALGRLQKPVQFFSGVSTDLFGAQLVRELHASGAKTDFLVRSARPTTLAFVTLTQGHAQYTFYDENTAGRMLTVDDLPDVGADISTLYFGGISLCSEPAAATYEALALREARRAVVMLDPNIRTSFITDEVAYRARLDRMIAIADIVKVSDEDLDWIVPGTQNHADKVETLHQKGASFVILTKGGAGASGFSQGHAAVHVAAPPATVVDTVGAGDTFNAGFLAKLFDLGLLTKDAVAGMGADAVTQALAYAAMVAAVTVSRRGADPPHLQDL